MTRVTSSILPANAHLWTHVTDTDFLDCYRCRSDLDVDTAMQSALQMPRWARALLSLRNRLVAPFGLKTGTSKDTTLFPITHRSESEINLGIDDTHLNFRIGLLQHQGHIYMATWVHRNNLLGRIYLAVVMPFHILISRNALRQVARATPANTQIT
ncbi:MAG: DUF2867 domain-containing protein [Thalassovita sp.]